MIIIRMLKKGNNTLLLIKKKRNKSVTVRSTNVALQTVVISSDSVHDRMKQVSETLT